jgi:hypothetical protein
MRIEIEDIPLVESSGRLGRRVVDSSLVDAYRMHRPNDAPLLGALSLNLGLQLTRLVEGGMFPSAVERAVLRQAPRLASYTQYFDCGGYDYGATCQEPCFGFAPHQMERWFCASCGEQAADPNNNPWFNWHYVGTRGSTIFYQDREPDICNGKDAWKWKINNCEGCAEAVFRCHDGYKRPDTQTYWEPTICIGKISCDGTLTQCP